MIGADVAGSRPIIRDGLRDFAFFASNRCNDRLPPARVHIGVAILNPPSGQREREFEARSRGEQREIILEYRRLIEIVAKLPKELVIASGHAGISDLIGSEKREF